MLDITLKMIKSIVMVVTGFPPEKNKAKFYRTFSHYLNIILTSQYVGILVDGLQYIYIFFLSQCSVYTELKIQ